MELLGTYAEVFFSSGVQIVTVYLLSKENLRRSRPELDAVLTEEDRFLRHIIPAVCSKVGATAKVAGSPELLPHPWDRIGEHLNPAQLHSEKKINLCIAYNPMLELAAALKEWSVTQRPDELITRLWVSDPVDLVIRTGGAETLSNFLPLQCGYARIIFIEELFNDTSVDTMLRIAKHHEGLELKYGW